MIDLDRVVGAALPTGRASWQADDVILYHLGIGAGVPPTDARELSYTYEAQLQVLPSFGVLPVFGTLTGLVGLDGVDINPLMVLHGEQAVTVHRPLPTRAEVTNTGTVTHVYDKGKGALLVAETETRDEATGELLCTNRFGVFARGEGGFGGPGGPPPGNAPPEREPDQVVESVTLPQQALLYRLSGDKNPLHADPGVAALAGFDRPILHGLCSYGIVLKAVVDQALEGDASRVASWEARFAGVVFPGETIVTSLWQEGDRLVVRADCAERGTPVISNAAVTTTS